MKTKSTIGAGSLDMLLDTMCNTFGGVCFVALMIAIISATLPPSNDQDLKEEELSEEMIVNKETMILIRKRDELKVAIDIQKTFVSTNTTKLTHTLSAIENNISSNEVALGKLKREKIELEDKLAKLTTDISYSKREAMRLERLLKALDEQLGRPDNMKNRTVRTPVERKLEGYRSLDVWIRKGKMYCLYNESHVHCNIIDGVSGKEWDYRTKPTGGFYMSDTFYHSPEYRQLIEMIKEKTYMRIFCDLVSFAQLCSLRDDLIRRRKMYNWHIEDGESIHFVEGYDGRVQ